ncbi:MAG: DNA gyrase inhibitor YacG, partial [Candidatus Dadabacteria bacterium]|nr:DNA gyrase inhibitor YacG [Candidatus Dadabacteria bacterium]
MNKHKYKCSQCGKSINEFINTHYLPFCCERCKLIDLGEWFNESHRILG